jgi:hypothetical protein
LEVQVAVIVSSCAGVVIQIGDVWKEAILAIFFFCTWFLLSCFCYWQVYIGCGFEDSGDSREAGGYSKPS